MLFHIPATHSVDASPGYNRDLIPELAAAMRNMPSRAQELHIKPLFTVNAAPKHVSYSLVEAEDPYSIALLLTDIPFKPDFKVAPVEYQETVLRRAMEEQGKGQ